MGDTNINVEASNPTPVRAVVPAGKERVPWQRMVLSLIGIAIIVGMWRWNTYHLYSLPEHSITAFTSISNNASYVIAAIVIFMVTGRLVYEWKNSTATAIVEETHHLFEKRNETINQKVEERVINEGEPGAPAVRPFTQTGEE